MDSDEEYYTSSTRTYGGSRSNRPGKPRTCMVIIGVGTAIFIMTVVLVVGIVVAQKNKGNENEEKKNECGPYTLPTGFNFSMLSPRVLSRQYTCPLLGDCWTGEQCYQCLKLDEWKVGNINNIPVCCENCLVRGLYVSNSECRCRK